MRKVEKVTTGKFVPIVGAAGPFSAKGFIRRTIDSVFY